MARKKKQPLPKIVQAWEQYFQKGELDDWRRFMRDLGFTQEFGSKTQCRKALTGVWVNIQDFLDDVEEGLPVRRHPSERALAQYTVEEEKIFPKRMIVKGSPLAKLMAHILH